LFIQFQLQQIWPLAGSHRSGLVTAGRPFAYNRHGPKVGAVAPFSGGSWVSI